MGDRYAALLRAVNVGGRNRVPMAELRALLTDLGYADVATHLQSGNAVFTAPDADTGALAARIADALGERLGVRTGVLVRSHHELAAVVDANPFPDAVADPTRLHVAYLSAAPDPARVAAVDATAYLPDEFEVVGAATYLRYVTNPGRSRLGTVCGRFGVVATARNWRTARALVEMTAG